MARIECGMQILFPTALLHIVSCQQHPDKYWPGGEDSDLSQPVEPERFAQLLGFILPVRQSSPLPVMIGGV